MPRFTDVYIRNLQPRETRYEVRESHGFGMRIFPSGEKSWQFVYTQLGRERRLTLGSYPAMTLKDARIAHAKAARLLAQGVDPADTKKATEMAARLAAEEERLNPTIKHLVEEYIEHWARPRKKSWKEDDRILKKDVVPVWGKRKAREITRRDVVLLLDRICARGAGVMANTVLAITRRMFNFAIERGILEANPAAVVRAPTVQHDRERALSITELATVWPALETARMAYHTRQALRLILATGQRPGEVIGLPWSELDETGAVWRLPADRAKNGHAHTIPLTSLALELLAELKEVSTSPVWVFPSPYTDNPITVSALGFAMRASFAAGSFPGVEPFTPHDLRRTVATGLGMLGFNRLVQDKVLNHVDRSTGGIYDRHDYQKEARIALETWGEYLRGLITGEAMPANIVPMARST